MLEILVLLWLTSAIGKMAEETGHSSSQYKVLTVVLWFGGEFVGMIIGMVILGRGESARCLVYPFAFGGAVIGAIIAYAIAENLTPETWLKTGPDGERAWLWRARLAKTDGERITWYRQVLTINPDNEEAKSRLAALQSRD